MRKKPTLSMPSIRKIFWASLFCLTSQTVLAQKYFLWEVAGFDSTNEVAKYFTTNKVPFKEKSVDTKTVTYHLYYIYPYSGVRTVDICVFHEVRAEAEIHLVLDMVCRVLDAEHREPAVAVKGRKLMIKDGSRTVFEMPIQRKPLPPPFKVMPDGTFQTIGEPARKK